MQKPATSTASRPPLDSPTVDLLREARDELLAAHRRIVEVQRRLHDGEALPVDWSSVIDAAVIVADAAKTLWPNEAAVVDDCGPLGLPFLTTDPSLTPA